MPLLEVTHLTFTHMGRTHPTLKDVQLTVNAGELVVLAGATGSGKSTLLNCLAGIAPEHTGGQLSGAVWYQGQEMTDWSIRQRSQVMGIMLQNVETQLFTDQVWEEIVFGLENWNLPPGEIQQLAHSAMLEFDLAGQTDWGIGQLSAGQKQRLLLACLSTRHQNLLLLDEPFAFLDQPGVDQLRKLLRQRADQGQGILVIEHRLDLLAQVCDRAYHMEAGQVTSWDLSSAITRQSVETSVSSRPIASMAVPTLPMLRTHNLSWGGYPAFPDLAVDAGDIVLIKGDNGCGKTTLLKLLSGLLPPTTGRLELGGQDATRQTLVQRAQMIGFVLQNPNHQLFAESVAAEMQPPGVVPEQTREWLAQLNLVHCAEKHPHALSQGQKRRLALGSVLARDPKVCLLDEIMVGQDATSLQLMLDALQRFTRQGGTLLFTSHDPVVETLLKPKVVALGG
jgi:energy-coupling factor transporter ATP-binding protein EcfA2